MDATTALDINVIVTRLLGEVPLVVAFIFFSIKIITIYQSDQEKSADKTSQMILTITNQWTKDCDRRDNEMREFLRAIRDQDHEVLKQISADLRANGELLQSIRGRIDNSMSGSTRRKVN